jgi:hypothetical protein
MSNRGGDQPKSFGQGRDGQHSSTGDSVHGYRRRANLWTPRSSGVTDIQGTVPAHHNTDANMTENVARHLEQSPTAQDSHQQLYDITELHNSYSSRDSQVSGGYRRDGQHRHDEIRRQAKAQTRAIEQPATQHPRQSPTASGDHQQPYDTTEFHNTRSHAVRGKARPWPESSIISETPHATHHPDLRMRRVAELASNVMERTGSSDTPTVPEKISRPLSEETAPPAKRQNQASEAARPSQPQDIPVTSRGGGEEHARKDTSSEGRISREQKEKLRIKSQYQKFKVLRLKKDESLENAITNTKKRAAELKRRISTNVHTSKDKGDIAEKVQRILYQLSPSDTGVTFKISSEKSKPQSTTEEDLLDELLKLRAPNQVIVAEERLYNAIAELREILRRTEPESRQTRYPETRPRQGLDVSLSSPHIADEMHPPAGDDDLSEERYRAKGLSNEGRDKIRAEPQDLENKLRNVILGKIDSKMTFLIHDIVKMAKNHEETVKDAEKVHKFLNGGYPNPSQDELKQIKEAVERLRKTLPNVRDDLPLRRQTARGQIDLFLKNLGSPEEYSQGSHPQQHPETQPETRLQQSTYTPHSTSRDRIQHTEPATHLEAFPRRGVASGSNRQLDAPSLAPQPAIGHETQFRLDEIPSQSNLAQELSRRGLQYETIQIDNQHEELSFYVIPDKQQLSITKRKATGIHFYHPSNPNFEVYIPWKVIEHIEYATYNQSRPMQDIVGTLNHYGPNSISGEQISHLLNCARGHGNRTSAGGWRVQIERPQPQGQHG